MSVDSMGWYWLIKGKNEEEDPMLIGAPPSGGSSV